METTIKRLRKSFRKANRRVDKAIARYKKALQPLYLPWSGDNTPEKASKYCLKADGTIGDYATKLSWAFYRRGRGGKFYEKPQTGKKKHCEVCNGPCYAACPYRHSEDIVGQDYLDLCKLEYAIDVAVYECESLLGELERLGVDVYNDAELWQ